MYANSSYYACKTFPESTLHACKKMVHIKMVTYPLKTPAKAKRIKYLQRLGVLPSSPIHKQACDILLNQFESERQNWAFHVKTHLRKWIWICLFWVGFFFFFFFFGGGGGGEGGQSEW